MGNLKMKILYVVLLLALTCIASRKVKKTLLKKKSTARSKRVFDESTCIFTREHKLEYAEISIKKGYVESTVVRENKKSPQDHLAAYCHAPSLFLRTLTKSSRTSYLCSGGSNGESDPIMFGFKPIIATNDKLPEDYLVPYKTNLPHANFKDYINAWIKTELEDETDSKSKIYRIDNTQVKYGQMCYNSPEDVGGKLFDPTKLTVFPSVSEDEACKIAYSKFSDRSKILLPQNEAAFTFGIPLNKISLKFFLIKVHTSLTNKGNICVKFGCGGTQPLKTANIDCDGYQNFKDEDLDLIFLAENILNEGFQDSDLDKDIQDNCKNIYQWKLDKDGKRYDQKKVLIDVKIVKMMQNDPWKTFFQYFKSLENKVRIKLRYAGSARCLALPVKLA